MEIWVFWFYKVDAALHNNQTNTVVAVGTEKPGRWLIFLAIKPNAPDSERSEKLQVFLAPVALRCC